MGVSVKGSTSVDARFRRKESLASVSAIWRENKHMENKLEMRVKQLEDKLRTEEVVNGETKEFLARKKISLEKSLEEWTNKYDQEISTVDSEIESVSKKRNTLLEKLGA